MKKIISLFFSTILLFFSVISYADFDNSLPSQNVNTFLYDNLFKGIKVYKVSDNTYYFSIRELAKLYNAVLDWKPVSSKVTMWLNNRKIDISANSSKVVFDRKTKKTFLPSRLIKNNIYISPEVITSKEFEEISDTQTSWDSSSLVLTVNHHANISAVRYFTKPEVTQIRVQLDKHLQYKVDSKSSDKITLTIFGGKIQKDSINVNNGIIKDISYETTGRSAVIRINLKQPHKNVKTTATSNPDEIAIEVEHSKNVSIITSKEVSFFEVKGEHSSADKKLEELDLTPPEKFGQSEIKEFDSLVEKDEDTKDLKEVFVTKFEPGTIIDDSSKITDDTISISGVASTKKEQRPAHKNRRKIIVIDPGHGGHDCGAVGITGTKEKDFNLQIALELKSLFNKDKDFEVILTREDDTFIPLSERPNIANENNADLFISIHNNSAFSKDINGFEVYFLSEEATDTEASATAALENSVLELEGRPSKKLAMIQQILWAMTMGEFMNESSELGAGICSQAGRLGTTIKGVKQGNFYVLRGARTPAVLVECAYVSNPLEESKLKTKKFCASAAEVIYKGAREYYAYKERDQNSKKK
jgi:N-acetylmuramoyl-L-alanine amidase